MIGTPFSYKKFKGGFRVQFIGYELDYKSRTMGISASRGKYVIEWIQNARRQKFVVLTRDFAEFLGRLGFVARTLHWLKPHLGPLYAWSAATARGTAATLPLTVILTLEYISKILIHFQNPSARKFPYQCQARAAAKRTFVPYGCEVCRRICGYRWLG